MKLRLRLTIFLICFPLVGYAQMYKCKQADGAITFQDSECTSGFSNAKVAAPPKSSSEPEGLQRAMGLNASCSQEVANATSFCSTTVQDVLLACAKLKLSANCLKQVNSPPGVKRDDTCINEMQSGTTQCTPEWIVATKQCARGRLSTKCSQQLSTAQNKNAKSSKLCDDAMRKWTDETRKCKVGSQAGQLQCIDAIKRDNNACKQ